MSVTPFEPEWNSYVTFEILNSPPLPAKIYANAGLTLVIFLEGDELCEISNVDRKVKYQHKQGILLQKVQTPPILETAMRSDCWG